MFCICLLSFIFTATTLFQATIIFLSSVHVASTQIPSDLFSILQDQVRSHHVISLFKMLQWLPMAFITLLKEAPLSLAFCCLHRSLAILALEHHMPYAKSFLPGASSLGFAYHILPILPIST
ncbi:hypothetical protein HJG60_011921 [Phyllostomus discolor]|uniref:Uncharacterized protein n=1 Tax=Phyllostomus discolor TaxID=89673 RepID=A0A833ZLS6_9CHIR|nr:hypothetical protein HJG60_011921 [Phyllostomus discolor]